MSIKNHILKGGFVLATSVAAFFHTVWVLGTLMSGEQPLPPNDLLTPEGAVFAVKTLAWHTPAALIALAIDIGFVDTSRRIERILHSGRKAGFMLYVTFGVLALTMYFLQFIYMAVHVPMVSLGDGVSLSLKQQLKGLFDIAVFVIPALLPIAITLYTFASGGHETTPQTPASAPTLHDTPPVAMDTPAPAPTIVVTPAPPAELPAPMTAQDVGLPAAQPTGMSVPRKRATKPKVDMFAAPTQKAMWDE